jgi:hypothetical protein
MNAESKSFDSPDEKRTFGHGHAEIVNLGGSTVGRTVFEPGWRWSQDVKPIAKTDLCQVDHAGATISGRLHVRMADGKEFEMGPGDVGTIPAGHDAWVVGNEPCVMIDWAGMTNYAKG